MVHISLDRNGDFDRTSPVFIPGTFKDPLFFYSVQQQTRTFNVLQEVQKVNREFDDAQQKLQLLMSKKV